jgi:hypothetical protein
MDHFDIWQWADFVRGLSDEATRLSMEGHLSSGCGRCRSTVSLLRQVADAARADSSYEPPAHAVRLATAVFSTTVSNTMSLPRLVARLVRDTARDPLPAGLRSTDRLSRRAVYVAGDYHVDLQVERQPASGLVTLIGQLASGRDTANIADVPVWLMERESLIGSTTCNAFGEFQLEYEPKGDLLLFLPLRDMGKRLEIPLHHLTSIAGARPGTAIRERKRSSRTPRD